MLSVPRVGRVLLQATLLLGAIATTVPNRAQGQATGVAARYASTAYGYSLRAPAFWVRIPTVRWTLAGPPADLTLMTPDHQAALGVIVAPTGNRVYSGPELQDVAFRLLAQENHLSPSVQIQTKRVVVNGVAYETAFGYLISGVPLMATLASVAVTQRHHRLYAIANLVYLQVYTTPPAGSGPAPTDTPYGNAQPPRRLQPAAVSTAGAGRHDAALAGAGDRQIPRERPSDPPAPLPTDRLRGNRCRTFQDDGLAVVDRNCAYKAELQATMTTLSTFTIDRAATDDHRPAAVGVDGFTSVSDPALGYRIEYPAQWTRVPAPGTRVFVRSADQNAGVGVTVARIDAASLSEPDLRSAADHQLATVATQPGPLVHRTVHVGGAAYVVALASGAGVTTPAGGLGQARILVVATASHHRLYTATGLGLTVLGAGEDTTAVLYPYFAPFTTLARRYQGTQDTHAQEADLALRAALTLFIDPHAPSSP